MTEPVEDAELLRRHLEGDPDAFGELVRRHRDRLWAVAVRTLGDREEAADAVQDAMISAFRSAHTFQGRSAVTTWLHRIVVNACLDRARRAATRRVRLVEDESALEKAAGHDEGADVSVERGELRRELSEALSTLPQEQRAALVLVDMQGYPVAEAAEVLGVPVGTVKSRCARARAKLLSHLSHLRGADGPRSLNASRETVSDLERRNPDPGDSRGHARDQGNPPAGRHVPSAGATATQAAGGELKA
ncbi:RNA polymerase sigma factor SigM [Streptacidiphilus rugosus]|uniref:RNA polymerase sigma factor SigM n=1 Tax=Streptacidiphilus rugosus TaxID=405783 RepID=UPI000AEFCD06|nr:RNA polymerase sigma factor SigM [Streptacidiphilus rugosus]